MWISLYDECNITRKIIVLLCSQWLLMWRSFPWIRYSFTFLGSPFVTLSFANMSRYFSRRWDASNLQELYIQLQSSFLQQVCCFIAFVVFFFLLFSEFLMILMAIVILCAVYEIISLSKTNKHLIDQHTGWYAQPNNIWRVCRRCLQFHLILI